MESKRIEGFQLEHLRDYSVRDRLLSQLFRHHQREGVPSSLANRFMVRFDLLIGLILNEGPNAPRVRELLGELREEFGYSRQFDPVLRELADLIENP